MDFFSTGEVSKKLNMSLRTLRYYDQIGLVVPTVRKDNGKRYYSNEDMLLLEKIALLKSTSMSLTDIQKVINQVSTNKVLLVHKEHLEMNIQQLQQSIQHTNTLLSILKIEGNIRWDQLTPLLSEDDENSKQKSKQKLWAQLFSEEEQSFLSEQLPKMEDDQGQTVKWINIIKRIELCLEEGKAAHSQEGQLIAEDFLLLSNETFGENQQLADKFWGARKSKETSTALHLYPIKREVMEFIEEAIIQNENR